MMPSRAPTSEPSEASSDPGDRTRVESVGGQPVYPRTAIVGPFPPHRGGIAHYGTSLAEALASHSAAAPLCLGFHRMYPERLFPGRSQYDHSASAFRWPAEAVLDPLRPTTWLHGARIVAAARPELVVFQWWHPFFAPAYRALGRLIRQRAPQARLITICHNVLPHESTPLQRGVARYGLGFSDGVLVHSEVDRAKLRYLVPWARSRVHGHPKYARFSNGASWTKSQARSKLGLDDAGPGRGRVALFFGYVRAYKGLKVAIEALAALPEDRRPLLLVAGEFYEDRTEYEALIDRLGLRPWVRVYDEYIENERVPEFFAAADLVVQPYLDASQSGVSQLAFAQSRPVVASAVGGIPEAIADGVTGLLVPPARADALAAAIDRFFEQDLGPAMIQQIREIEAGQSEWHSLAQTLFELSAAAGGATLGEGRGAL